MQRPNINSAHNSNYSTLARELGLANAKISVSDVVSQIPDSSIPIVVGAQHRNHILGRTIVRARKATFEYSFHPLSGFCVYSSVVKAESHQKDLPSHFSERVIEVQMSDLMLLSYGGVDVLKSDAGCKTYERARWKRGR